LIVAEIKQPGAANLADAAEPAGALLRGRDAE
jgi:hypothetical protein